MSKLVLDAVLAETTVGYVALNGREFVCFAAPLHPVCVYRDWATASTVAAGQEAEVKPINFGQLFAMGQTGLWFLLESEAADRLVRCLNQVPGFPKFDTNKTGWTLWGKGTTDDSGKFIADLEQTNDDLAAAGLVPPVPPETRIVGFMGLLDGKRMVRCLAGPLHPVLLCLSPEGLKTWAATHMPDVKRIEAQAVSVKLMTTGLSAGELFWLEPPVVRRFTSLNLAAFLDLPMPPVVSGGSHFQTVPAPGVPGDAVTGLLVGPRHRPPQEVKKGNGHKEFLATAQNIARMLVAKN